MLQLSTSWTIQIYPQGVKQYELMMDHRSLRSIDGTRSSIGMTLQPKDKICVAPLAILAVRTHRPAPPPPS
ncbi:hypothetical protein PGT21_006385 [Puccinia graminis f. sp. tritici]|uniref:Uncharacterized protein n=1 Tax=Puccinia graminis f. sp. tritici TaxID=56615 RepID=A0A5B0MV81_PUCGR|nr:hypothetical protein PGTUg99_026421 [Puccinia graminis f. sp. tritici]KAA1103973.1 hypothetical protein PGT21_006385 [Puccinia graminis f. sp. tritici]